MISSLYSGKKYSIGLSLQTPQEGCITSLETAMFMQFSAAVKTNKTKVKVKLKTCNLLTDWIQVSLSILFSVS